MRLYGPNSGISEKLYIAFHYYNTLKSANLLLLSRTWNFASIVLIYVGHHNLEKQIYLAELWILSIS